MGCAAKSGRGEIDLPRIGLCVGDQLGNRCDRNRRMDHHHVGKTDYAGDRGDIAQEVEAELFIERGVDRSWWANKKERVAVGGRTYDRRGAKIAAGAGAVLDNELPAQSV